MPKLLQEFVLVHALRASHVADAAIRIQPPLLKDFVAVSLNFPLRRPRVAEKVLLAASRHR